MSYRVCLMVMTLLMTLIGCSQLKQTGQTLSDSHGVLQDSSERYLGNHRYRLRVMGSTIVFNGQAEQLFQRRAEQYTESLGCRGWKLHEYKSGTENTLLGARQYAEGVVECL
ncbi:hypothetical protein [Chitinimonas sp. BJB300]|uniref:hypothetical protein n=1 Tax=Chitinimonas sp. BJB300 TaxID=1559339 RepID=UPI000C0D3018|nr:hypothetical protein [Chitinimonas sp. BJB300]PHV12764.1 hypothetical protein CSQ89_03830 [Chitinimonas sp. BJB300]TSJ91366.1 hypothetical protein FG002_003495 [Chitinimonas sp. BJB300]